MKSFGSDRPRLSVKPLALPPATDGLARHPAGVTGAARPGEAGCGGASPHVETVKQGDKVVRLVVTCGCGERIEIDCLYPAGG